MWYVYQIFEILDLFGCLTVVSFLCIYCLLDHNTFDPTQVVIFDHRAGGSGCAERLWKHFFLEKDNILVAAIDLLQNCSSCESDTTFDGGCPACLHLSNCLKFNQYLSKSSAIVIGKRMLERIKESQLYKENCYLKNHESKIITNSTTYRTSALAKAKQLQGAKNRSYVVGRPSWPMDYGGVGREDE